MSIVVTALVEQSGEAESILEALEKAHFEAVKIDHQSTSISSGDELDADDLMKLKLAGDEARFFADRIVDGSSLLVISSEVDRVHEIFALMDRFDLQELASAGRPSRLRFQKPLISPDEAIHEGGAHHRERTLRKLHRADSERHVGEHDTGDASGLSRRAYASQRGGPDSGSTEGRFEQMESAFRKHYDDHFADNSIPYVEYVRAYRFGMVLARHSGFRDQDWEQIEPYAKKGWDSQTHGRWEDFQRAVRFGWQSVRGDQEHRRRPR